MVRYNPSEVSINEPPLSRKELIELGLEKEVNFEIPKISPERTKEIIAEIEAAKEKDRQEFAQNIKSCHPAPTAKDVYENFSCAGITESGIKTAWELREDRQEFYVINKNAALCGTTQSGKSTRMLATLFANYSGENLFINDKEVFPRFWIGKTAAPNILWIDWVKACKRTYWQASSTDKAMKPSFQKQYKIIFVDDFGQETKDAEAIDNFRNFVWEQHAGGAVFIMTSNATSSEELRAVFRSLFINSDPVFARCGASVVYTKMFAGIKY